MVFGTEVCVKRVIKGVTQSITFAEREGTDWRSTFGSLECTLFKLNGLRQIFRDTEALYYSGPAFHSVVEAVTG